MSIAEQLRPEHRSLHRSAADRFSTALPALVAEVARETTTSNVAARIAKAFVHTLGARSARVYLSGADPSTLKLAAAEEVAPSAAVELSADGDLPAAAAVRRGLLELQDIADVSGRRRRDAGAAAPPGSGVALGLPLFAGAATIGAVSAGFDELEPEACAALTVLSSSLGAIVDGARIRAELAGLEARARMREEQTAIVVHELRQPLNALLLIATHRAKRAIGAEVLWFERLRRVGLRLEALISDLSDTSFLESGVFPLRIAPTDVAALVATSVEHCAPNAVVSIDRNIPLLDIDPRRVEQVLTNLLVNAQKHGNEPSAPEVTLTRRGGAIVISVTNEGGGIADDERTKVFEPYYRGRERKPGTRGLGLGLYICRKLVEGHGGEIWTDRDASRTRFSFSLPIPEPEPRASEKRMRGARREEL